MEEINREVAKVILKGKTAVAISGGGSLGVGEVGALERLYELGAFKKLTHIAGSSVGSILAATLAAGATPEFIKKTIIGLDMNQFEDNSIGYIRDIYRLIKKYGWNKGEAITRWAEMLMCELTGKSTITIKELYEQSGIHLTITYWSYRFRKTRYIDHILQPDIQVAEAIRMSSSIPIYYQAVWKKVITIDKQEVMDIALDGGVTDNYPIHVLRDQGVEPRKIIGLRFYGTKDVEVYNAERRDEDYQYELPNTLKEAITTLISAMRQEAMNSHVSKKDWMLTVKIPVGYLRSTDFDMTQQEKDWLLENGRNAVDNYLDEITELYSQGVYP